jgi:hypothetical protein
MEPSIKSRNVDEKLVEKLPAGNMVRIPIV